MAGVLAVAAAFLRRQSGSAGAPTTLLSGQPFFNEVENVLYYGFGGSPGGQSSSQIKIGGSGAFVDLTSAQSVAGRKTFSVSPTVPNGSAASDAAAFGQIASALAPYAQLASPAFTGAPTTPTPASNDNSNIVANTSWVQSLVSALAAGLQPKPTAAYATAAALPAYTYNNSAGTITANANGALTIDTGSPQVNDVVLINQETGANNPYNGLYVVSAVGGSSAPFKLTRHVDMNTGGQFPGAFIPVENYSLATGGTQSNTLWLCNPARSFTLGTTAVPFTQLNSPTTFANGAGITISGQTISVTGLGSVASGSMLKISGTGTAATFVAAVPGTDYVAPFASIDPGTA